MPPIIQLPVHNLVIEWRYPPNLALYSIMDKVGLALADKFPDWQRSPLTLEVRHKTYHRRFFMSHRRAFYEFVNGDNRDVTEEITLACEVFDRFSNDLKLERVGRIGFRQWAAFPWEFGPTEKRSKTLAARAKDKFHNPEGLLDCLHGTIEDIAYVVDVSTAKGWGYSLRAGPMDRKQWCEVVPAPKEVFPGEEDFLKYEASIPAHFLFIDIDCKIDDLTAPSRVREWLTESRRTSHEVMNDLTKHFMNGA